MSYLDSSSFCFLGAERYHSGTSCARGTMRLRSCFTYTASSANSPSVNISSYSPPSPPLPLSIVLLGPCRPSIPPDLCGQHWNHLLLDQETQRTRHPGIAGRMGLCMVRYLVTRSHYHSRINQGYSHLLVTKPSKSRALESFVVETCENSTHMAMFVR